MSEPILIDTKMHGYEQITGAFVVQGDQTALVETGPKTSVDAVVAGLDSAGVEDVDWIVVTHIHLDHAGGAGTLAQRWPDATVAVHTVGAPHLADPAKLWSSASRIYGDRMEKLWGGIDPISPDRIRALEDGDKIDLGGRILEAIDTPGHAGHHHAFLDDTSGWVLCGDAIGVSLPGTRTIRPATPPPEFDLERAVESIERIRSIAPASVCLTHFGPAPRSVDETCDEAIEALRTWGSWVEKARARTDDLDAATELVVAESRAAVEGLLDPAEIDRLEQTTSYRMNVSGYMRYFSKLESA